DLQVEEGGRIDLTLGVGLEGDGAATVERVVEQKVERPQVGQLEAFDSAHHPAEVPGHSRRRHGAGQQGVQLRLERNETDIGGVNLVARARVRQPPELDRHGSVSRTTGARLGSAAAGLLTATHTSAFHAARISTRTFGSISRRSTSAGQYATISSTCGRPPAKPVTLGGPVSTSGASSRVNRSTGARSRARTPTRSCTSGASGSGVPASRPWVASAPTNSVRICSNSSPRSARRARSTRSPSFALAWASGQAYTSVPTALYP